ncbi:MAG: sigma-70 family RNA polymerase sigma factor [Phycisphaerales bacterium]|nr:sigma-70 family RNA polymerase sigma factor [Phycisphaerales bacterium]
MIDPAIVESMERMSAHFDGTAGLWFEERSKHLNDCLGELSPEQSNLLTLAYRERLRLKAVSSLVGLAEETVKKRLSWSSCSSQRPAKGRRSTRWRVPGPLRRLGECGGSA